MYDEELDMALEDAYDDGYVQALIDMGVDPNEIAEEDVDMFDDNYFDEAMEGNPENKAKRREWESQRASKYKYDRFGYERNERDRINALRDANRYIWFDKANGDGKIGYKDNSRDVTDKQRHMHKSGPAQQYASQFQKVRDKNVRIAGKDTGWRRRDRLIDEREDRELKQLDGARKQIERSGYNMPDYEKRKSSIESKAVRLRKANDKLNYSN